MINFAPFNQKDKIIPRIDAYLFPSKGLPIPYNHEVPIICPGVQEPVSQHSLSTNHIHPKGTSIWKLRPLACVDQAPHTAED